jgi:hypothetical protein
MSWRVFLKKKNSLKAYTIALQSGFFFQQKFAASHLFAKNNNKQT